MFKIPFLNPFDGLISVAFSHKIKYGAFICSKWGSYHQNYGETNHWQMMIDRLWSTGLGIPGLFGSIFGTIVGTPINQPVYIQWISLLKWVVSQKSSEIHIYLTTICRLIKILTEWRLKSLIQCPRWLIKYPIWSDVHGSKVKLWAHLDFPNPFWKL